MSEELAAAFGELAAFLAAHRVDVFIQASYDSGAWDVTVAQPSDSLIRFKGQSAGGDLTHCIREAIREYLAFEVETERFLSGRKAKE